MNKGRTIISPASSSVLFVYPHPDDETFFNAGLIQRFLISYVNVFVLCLTTGEASTLAYGLKATQSLPEVRKQEFESAMKYLGVKNYKICSLPDNNLVNNREEVHKTVEEYIDLIKPDNIITFEPFGCYGHPDHIVTSEIVTNIANEKSINLIYSTVKYGYKFSKESMAMSQAQQNNKPLKPNYIFPLNISAYFKKLRALRMYKSQHSFKKNLLHKIYQLAFMDREYYFLTMK